MRIRKKVKVNPTSWHTWFAWHPVTIGDYTVWLERVYRRVYYWSDGWYYEYGFVYSYPKE